MTNFRPFFNPATGEWIEYTAIAGHKEGELVRFNWRSVPGGTLTEHVHPGQEERFTTCHVGWRSYSQLGFCWPQRRGLSASPRSYCKWRRSAEAMVLLAVRIWRAAEPAAPVSDDQELTLVTL
jgi:hypothetical protein